MLVKPDACQPKPEADAPGFSELLLSANVCIRVCLCLSLRLLIASGMMGVILTPYDWSNKFYNFYMAAVVNIVSELDVSIHTDCGNQPNKSNIVLYKPLLHF